MNYIIRIGFNFQTINFPTSHLLGIITKYLAQTFNTTVRISNITITIVTTITVGIYKMQY